MKVSVAGFAWLLATGASALAVWDPPTESPEGHDQPIPRPVNCCLEYTRVQIPLDRLVGYERSNSRCPKPAVIFITKRNKEICANPAEKWVQDRISQLPPPN